METQIPGKKARGIAGSNNAKSIPFRKGGRSCDYDISPRPVSAPSGNSKMLTAVLFSTVFDGGASITNRLAGLCEEAIHRCTSPVIS